MEKHPSMTQGIRLEPFSVPQIKVPTAFAELDENLLTTAKSYIDCSGCENRDASEHVVKAISEAISSHPELIWDHWNSQDKNLRRKIAHANNVSIEQVFITSGAFSGIEYCFKIFTRAGTKTGLLRPDWPGFLDFATSHRNITFSIENLEFPFIIGAEQLGRGVDQAGSDFVIFANPMPINGNLIAKVELSNLFLSFSETLFIVDEADSVSPSLQAGDLVNRHNNCIFLGSLSKFYGLAGLRVGYLIAPLCFAEHFKNTISSMEVSSIAVLAANLVWNDINYQGRTQRNVASSIQALQAACSGTSYELAATPHCFSCYIYSRERDPKIDLQEYGIRILEGAFFRLPENVSGGRFNLADPRTAHIAADAIRAIHNV